MLQSWFQVSLWFTNYFFVYSCLCDCEHVENLCGVFLLSLDLSQGRLGSVKSYLMHTFYLRMDCSAKLHLVFAVPYGAMVSDTKRFLSLISESRPIRKCMGLLVCACLWTQKKPVSVTSYQSPQAMHSLIILISNLHFLFLHVQTNNDGNRVSVNC